MNDVETRRSKRSSGQGPGTAVLSGERQGLPWRVGAALSAGRNMATNGEYFRTAVAVVKKLVALNLELVYLFVLERQIRPLEHTHFAVRCQ